MTMLLGAIADDFTGASDLANTLAKGGMAVTQFVGIPDGAAAAGCEAGVVALKTRSIAPDLAVAQSLDAARWLLDQGCEQIIFKYCSTFDSTPQGNIGPVAEALLDFLGTDLAIVCPAFPATGRRIFMGHLFVGDVLLNQSGMENHPLTPMTDPNLVAWLRRQTKGDIGLVRLDVVRAGADAVTIALDKERTMGRRLVVADATIDDDLRTLGAAIAGHKLITGGSGIALGLPDNFRKAGRLAGTGTNIGAIDGPAIVLCGSCSTTSQAQVAAYAANHPSLAIVPAELMESKMTVAKAAAWCRTQTTTPIVYSSAERSSVAASQSLFGRDEIAQTIEAFFGALVADLVASGTTRIVVGGGETSGAVVEVLGLSSLEIGREIDPGVPVLRAAREKTPLGLALKSGNFGRPDFFANALHQIATP